MSRSGQIPFAVALRSGRANVLTAGALAALALSAAACSNSPAPASTGTPAEAVRPSLATSLVTKQGTFATVPTTGYWQVLFLASGTARWKLDTPPGVADNGGVVLAPAANAGMLAAFRPSERLAYTPLARKASVTARWRAAGIIESDLESSPAALAAGPGSEYAALLRGGTEAEAAGPRTGSATESIQSLRTTPGGAGLTRLTAVVWSSRRRAAVLAGASSRKGVVPVFAGPPGKIALLAAAPRSLQGSTVAVLDLSSGSAALSALLVVSGAHGQVLEAADLPSGSTSWSVGRPVALPKGSDTPLTEPFVEHAGGTGWVYWAGGGAPVDVTTGVNAGWTSYASPPTHTSGLAAVASGDSPQLYAFATRNGSDIVEIYRLEDDGWSISQALSVPLALGG